MTKHGIFFRIGSGALGAVLGALAFLWAAGCTTTSPSGAKVTASLVVTNHNLEQIRMASISVFRKNGYEVKTAFGRNLVFEKYGGTGSAILYGTWMDPSVWYRVKLHIEELSVSEQVLECNVYRIRDRDDAILEEESRAYNKGKAPFKKLLGDIQATLNGKASAEAKPAKSP